MAYTDPVTGQRIGRSASVWGVKWPTTRAERHAMIRGRWRAYRKEPFEDEEVVRLALFEAVDTADNITAVTQRLVRDYAFVCDVDARAIATDGVALGVQPDAPDGALDAGRVEWTASGIDARLPAWGLALAVEGRGYVEVIARADNVGPAIVWHSDTEVDIETDAAGLTVTRAIVTIMEPPPLVLGEDGAAEPPGQMVTVVREITPTEVRTWRDGIRVEAESGPNPLGIVPVIPVEFGYGGPGGMPTNAAQGLDDVLALINSTITQIATIGSRNGNPVLLAIGTRIADGEDLQKTGKVLSTVADADIKWLELSMQGLGALVTQITSVVDMTRATLPEFLFMESGANASGTALGYRAGAFVAKMQPVRSMMYGALARAVAIAVAMRANRRWDESAAVYVVEGGSALPMDVTSQSDLRVGLVDKGLMRRADYVAWAQGARLLPQGIDPEVYAARAMAELDASTRELSDALRLLQQVQASTTVADLADTVEAAEAADDAEDTAETETPDTPDGQDMPDGAQPEPLTPES